MSRHVIVSVNSIMDTLPHPGTPHDSPHPPFMIAAFIALVSLCPRRYVSVPLYVACCWRVFAREKEACPCCEVNVIDMISDLQDLIEGKQERLNIRNPLTLIIPSAQQTLPLFLKIFFNRLSLSCCAGAPDAKLANISLFDQYKHQREPLSVLKRQEE